MSAASFPPIGPNSTWNGGEHRGVWYITEYINHEPVMMWKCEPGGEWVGTPYAGPSPHLRYDHAVNQFTSKVVFMSDDRGGSDG